MKLILFDIDGTLIDSGGAGRRALDLALGEAFSIDTPFDGIFMAGKTDTQIVREALEKHGLSTGNGVIPGILDSYLRHLEREMDNPLKHMKPGIRETLDRLDRMPGIHLGLLTGNVAEGARIKLESFGIFHYFPLGAYGSDHEDRSILLPEATRRFMEHTGNRIDYERCVIVGDTPRDVECAKPYGAKTVAVATGPYSMEALDAAGADLVLKDLTLQKELIDC